MVSFDCVTSYAYRCVRRCATLFTHREVCVGGSMADLSFEKGMISFLTDRKIEREQQM